MAAAVLPSALLLISGRADPAAIAAAIVSSVLIAAVAYSAGRCGRLAREIERERELRRGAEERERRLAAELRHAGAEAAHRFDNNMQLVSSLLSLQRGSTADESGRDHIVELRNRIQALMLAYSADGGRPGDDTIGARAYFGTLTQHLRTEHSSHFAAVGISAHVEDVVLDRNTAFGLGLIVNELVTNAMIHAFPDRKAGMIVVELKSGPGGYTLSVTDDGIGIREETLIESRWGLGLALVREMGAQLGATVVCETRAGTSFTIAPVPAGAPPSEPGDRR